MPLGIGESSCLSEYPILTIPGFDNPPFWCVKMAYPHNASNLMWMSIDQPLVIWNQPFEPWLMKVRWSYRHFGETMVRYLSRCSMLKLSIVARQVSGHFMQLTCTKSHGSCENGVWAALAALWGNMIDTWQWNNHTLSDRWNRWLVLLMEIIVRLNVFAKMAIISSDQKFVNVYQAGWNLPFSG